MLPTRRVTVWLTLIAMLGSIAITPHSQAGKRWYQSSTTIDQLAKSIDKLQKHIDQYGTIVAKTPDVWGESRLMRHRDDFESKFTVDGNDFNQVLSAAQGTRDGAFLASALSLQNTLAGNQPLPSGKNGETITQTVNAPALNVVGFVPGVSAGGGSPATPSFSFGAPTFLPKFNEPNVEADKSLRLSTEPEIYLDQKKRFYDHLNQIRRLNEGDDTADSPGYALNLVRIPVSLLPGRKTRIGHGAEVNITIEPVLGEDLLPETFRDFVINDVVNRIAPSVTAYVNSDGKKKECAEKAWDKYRAAIIQKLNFKRIEFKRKVEEKLKQFGSNQDPELRIAMMKEVQLEEEYEEQNPEQNKTGKQIPATERMEQGETTDRAEKVYDDNINEAKEDLQESFHKLALTVKDELFSPSISNGRPRSNVSTPPSHQQAVNGTSLAAIMIKTDGLISNSGIVHLSEIKAFLRLELAATYEFLTHDAVLPLWHSHCTQALADSIHEHRRVSLDDKYHDYLKSTSKTYLNEFRPNISKLRKDFFTDIVKYHPEANFTLTGHLAWHVMVESALLNERLVEDMKSLASSKNAYHLCTDWQAYYGPNPPPEARGAFNDYVRTRWPIHVFALDPVTQDQNVGSSFSRRREMQMVLALAASNKLMTAQSLTRFVRRLEYDLETIELNRTAVAFNHGNEDFGWRFYPRVQSPKVPGNLTAITRDLLIGGQSHDSLQKDRMIEPGIRECTALVVMPSFVPYLNVDVRTNWFNLTGNPLCLRPALKRTMDVSDAVQLSEEITEMRQLSQKCIQDAHLYRPNEVHRLMKAVQQLESQLPMQTEFVQIPYENTSGGFEIFNSGVTDLSPELIDWYGAPGIVVNDEETPSLQSSKTVITIDDAGKKKTNITKPHPDGTPPAFGGTTIFLIGKNFTALGDGTRIIAGGADISDTRVLVSREVMQVTIPPSVATEEHDLHGDKPQQYVGVHIATPYGVTRRLLVKVLNPSADSAADAKAAAKKAVAAAKTAEKAANKAETVTTTAIEEHRAQKHFDKFHWSEESIESCYELYPNGTVKQNFPFEQKTSTTLDDESVVLDFGQDFAPSFTAKLGIIPWVKKDGEYVKSSKPFVLSKMVTRHSHGKSLYIAGRQPADLIGTIVQETFQNLDIDDLPPKAKSIKYQLYLRMDAPPGEAGKVFKVENDLVINFKKCEAKKCCPKPAADSEEETEAEAPAPASQEQNPAEEAAPDEASLLPVIDLLPPPPAAAREGGKRTANRLPSPIPLKSYLTAPGKVFQ